MRIVYAVIVLLMHVGIVHAASARKTRRAACKEIEQKIDQIACTPEGYRRLPPEECIARIDALIELNRRYRRLTGDYYRGSFKPSNTLDKSLVAAGCKGEIMDKAARDARNDFLKNYLGLKEEQQ